MCERIDNRSHLDGGQHGLPRPGLPAWIIEEQLLPAGVQEPASSDHVQSASQILQHYAHWTGEFYLPEIMDLWVSKRAFNFFLFFTFIWQQFSAFPPQRQRAGAKIPPCKPIRLLPPIILTSAVELSRGCSLLRCINLHLSADRFNLVYRLSGSFSCAPIFRHLSVAVITSRALYSLARNYSKGSISGRSGADICNLRSVTQACRFSFSFAHSDTLELQNCTHYAHCDSGLWLFQN